MRFDVPFSLRAALLTLSVVLALSTRAHSEMVRFELERREAYAGGRSFGEHGSYEMLRGRAYFEVDPKNAHNRNIVDIDLAPRNAKGVVEFSADVGILKPVDVSKSNGAVFYDVNNRGSPTCLGIIGGGADHFFARHGYIVVFSGWIAELLPNPSKYHLRAPVARDGAREITGLVLSEMTPNRDTKRLSVAHWGGHGCYEPTECGEREAKLTWRLREKDPRRPIPREQYRLTKSWPESNGVRSQLPRIDIELAGGFHSGGIYELVYEAKNPIVQGLGLAGIRDLISCFKHSLGEENPLRMSAGRVAVTFAYGFGTSQSGRCVRQFLFDGFNSDESGRIVFDGAIPHVTGGGLGFFNHRFASPTRHNTQHDHHNYPADVFPFTYGDERDPFTGRVDGILKRSRATNTVPKVFHTQSSSEYWHRSGSLVHTDPLGQRDSVLPDEVRIYTFGGAQHGPGDGSPRQRSNGQLPPNPSDYRPLMRALVVAMDAWVRDGTEPPPSVYPKIADGTLVGWREIESGWKPLPGVRYPSVIQQPEFFDRGPEFLTKRRATILPPESRGDYVVKVPRFDADNNELGTLDLPSVSVPVATFTSWNLRHRSIGAETELLSLQGGYIPFPVTERERKANGDPRLSVVERYERFDKYLERFQKATRKLVDSRYVLEEDVERLERLPWGHEKLFE